MVIIKNVPIVIPCMLLYPNRIQSDKMVMLTKVTNFGGFHWVVGVSLDPLLDA